MKLPAATYPNGVQCGAHILYNKSNAGGLSGGGLKLINLFIYLFEVLSIAL